MELAKRMKRYEAAFTHQLPDRMPIILRVDGKAFHTYTSSLKKNDMNMIRAMWCASQMLCNQIVGARMAYVQSDEISVLINPWMNHDSQPWFDNTLQKIVSVSAAIASAIVTVESPNVFGKIKPAFFDSRAFAIPAEEVNNYFVWRQQDAMRNSVQILMRENFSHKEAQGKSQRMMLEDLMTKGIIWEDSPIYLQRGACIVRRLQESDPGHIVSKRMKWCVDDTIPVFTRDQNYVVSHLNKTEDSVDEKPATSSVLEVEKNESFKIRLGENP